jgi:CRP-like cAMP-binding protein
VVVREGDPGDRFYVLTGGSASVTVAGSARPTLHAGDGFGEIALLRNVPRTATVTASGALEVLTLGRDRFLSGIAASPVSTEQAESLARLRLAADPPSSSSGSEGSEER